MRSNKISDSLTQKFKNSTYFFDTLLLIVLFSVAAAPLFCDAACPQAQAREALVRRVIDGDTFELENGERVRLIGIDSPEYEPLKNHVQFFGKEASDYARGLLDRKKIRLENDIEPRDKYGRTLAYAYLEDGQLVNRLLVREGHARAKYFPPNGRYRRELNNAQKEAQKSKKGLWARTR